MRFSATFAFIGAFVVGITASPTTVDYTLTPRQDACSAWSSTLKDCMGHCMKPFRDTIPQAIFCRAECNQQLCCADKSLVSTCDGCKDVICDNTHEEVPDTIHHLDDDLAQPINENVVDSLNARDNLEAAAPTRCDACKATYVMYQTKNDCDTAMSKMCNSYCRNECDYDCACKIWEHPDRIASCVVTGGRNCVLG